MISLQPWGQASLLILGWCLLALWCFRASLRQRWHSRRAAHPDLPATLVAYASEGGTAAALAGDLAQQLEQGGEAVALLSLNQLSRQQLAVSRRLLIIASTCGDGEAPANGQHFLRRLQQALQQGQHLLQDVRYAVLALGDDDYPQFCAFGLQLHKQLQQAGAQPMFAPLCVNRLERQSLEHWQQQLAEQGFSVADTAQGCDSVKEELTLEQRLWLNPGSPGAALYELHLSKPQHSHWQAGDIARLWLAGRYRDYSIASLPEENHLRLRSNPAFHAPPTAVPLILIGNGTGLAGLRAHLKQRSLQNSQAPCWLLFGERSPEHDRIWQQELDHWYQSGVLTELDRCYSRASGAAELPALCGRSHSGYVQHALQREQKRLRQWLKQDAAIYICGSRDGMASDIDQLLQQWLGKRATERLQQQGRYRKDVY
jgi:sulfite reductase (NADPH) flavoprotein alpha-component